MGAIDWDLQKYDGEFKKAGMERVKRAADAIRDQAKLNCKVGTINRPERKHFVFDGHLLPAAGGAPWTARQIGAMKKTIRTVEPRNSAESTFDKREDNVRVYAGNFLTWWATQMEFGRAGWKGGPKPFLRTALRTEESKIRSIIEGR